MRRDSTHPAPPGLRGLDGGLKVTLIVSEGTTLVKKTDPLYGAAEVDGRKASLSTSTTRPFVETTPPPCGMPAEPPNRPRNSCVGTPQPDLVETGRKRCRISRGLRRSDAVIRMRGTVKSPSALALFPWRGEAGTEHREEADAALHDRDSVRRFFSQIGKLRPEGWEVNTRIVSASLILLAVMTFPGASPGQNGTRPKPNPVGRRAPSAVDPRLDLAGQALDLEKQGKYREALGLLERLDDNDFIIPGHPELTGETEEGVFIAEWSPPRPIGNRRLAMMRCHLRAAGVRAPLVTRACDGVLSRIILARSRSMVGQASSTVTALACTARTAKAKRPGSAANV
jgi:hypothetical protein